MDATFLVDYTGGIIWDAPEFHSQRHNHGVEIVGWGYDKETGKSIGCVTRMDGLSLIVFRSPVLVGAKFVGYLLG